MRDLRHQRIALATWLLLAAALLLRAFVPQGYMPQREAGGGISVSLCGTDGVWLIPLHKSVDDDQPDRQRAEGPCLLAGFAMAAGLPPPAPVLPALPSAQRRPVEITFAQAGDEVGAYLHPPARAPPVNV